MALPLPAPPPPPRTSDIISESTTRPCTVRTDLEGTASPTDGSAASSVTTNTTLMNAGKAAASARISASKTSSGGGDGGDGFNHLHRRRCGTMRVGSGGNGSSGACEAIHGWPQLTGFARDGI